MLTEQLEESSPYSNADGKPFFLRINTALQQIPTEHREAALLIFSRILYIPTTFLDEIWRYLWFEFSRSLELGPDSIGDALPEIHFFEVDQCGMTSHFAHLNRISGRLDVDTRARVPDVGGVIQLIRDLTSMHSSIKDHAADQLRMICSKKHWVILTDKALSGHSLSSDLQRFLLITDLLRERLGIDISITVLAQIVTAQAREFISESCISSEQASIRLIGGAELESGCQISNAACPWFDTSQRAQIDDLCQWFAETYLVCDTNFDRMREKSHDNLAYGYRNCGLTICDQANCPTDSLPLLWYHSSLNPKIDAKRPYHGPYPRVHSRLGNQLINPSSSCLSDIPDWQDCLLDSINL